MCKWSILQVRLTRLGCYSLTYRGGPYKRSLISSDFPAPKMEPQSGHTASAVSVHWLQCGNCDAAPPTQHSPMHLYSAYSATPRHVSHENLNVNNTISKT